MSKAVAIPYIIALIIGIVVVGVIGYWFFSMAGKGGGGANTIECDSKILTYCQGLRDNGWRSEPILQGWDTTCGAKPSVPPSYCAGKLGMVCTCNYDNADACKRAGYTFWTSTAFITEGCGGFCCK